MKLLLLSHTDQSPLVHRLQERGHAVMAVLGECDDLFQAICRHRPHAVLVCGMAGDNFTRKAVDFVSSLPDQRLILRQPADSRETLDQQLAKIRRQVDLHKQPPIADQRQILFDPGYAGLLDGGKLRSFEPEGERLHAEQEKLLILLEAATLRHPEACRYREELRSWQYDETREISYRIMHGSLKGLAYGQEQAGRLLAVPAHYVPGVDPCYLPTPGDAMTGFRWVFDGPSPEAAYAYAGVKALRFIPAAQSTIETFFGSTATQAETPLISASIGLMGGCALLEQVADAHLAVMERCLSSRSGDELLEDVTDRKRRREHQVFCEFWDLPIMREWPQLFAQTVEDFRGGRRVSVKPIIPDFRDILAARLYDQPGG